MLSQTSKSAKSKSNTSLFSFFTGNRSEAQLSIPQFTLTGVVSKGLHTDYAISGEDILVDANTWTIGVLRLGATATVSGIYRTGGVRYARKINLNQ